MRKTDFPQKLKLLRLRRNWTQGHIAEQIGTTTVNVSRWERGQLSPSLYFRQRLCDLFNTNTDELGFVLTEAEPSVEQHSPPYGEDQHEGEKRPGETASHPSSPAFFWHVPYARNPLFTGREEVLHILHTHLGADQITALTQFYALHGLGGVGKTQIALEYAYRYASEYSAIFWINAETAEKVATSLLQIAERLQLPERQEVDKPRIIAAVQRWLMTCSGWLLILDNLDNLELLHRWLPSGRQGTILLTTRHQALGTIAQGIALTPMGQEEGILFLLRRAKMLGPAATSEHMQQLVASMPAEYAAAEALTTAMGGLPLALDQAGAYIEETGCSLAHYLQRYEQQRALLLNRRGVLGRDHPHSVTATFFLASAQVEREQRAAADLLRVCAFLHAEAIPEELFVVGAVHLGTDLASLAANPSEFDLAIAVLRRLSLVQRQAQGRTFSIHRLVQAVLREIMSEQEQAMWLRRVITALNALFPKSPTEVQVWDRCERFLPHVLACAAAIPEQAEDRELSEVLQKAANYLRKRAQYEQAEPLYQRALRMREQQLGPEHPDVAHSLNDLGLLYYEQGKYVEAELLYQRALRIWEQQLGPEHPDVASPLNNLGLLHYEQGKYVEAELLYQRALRMREQQLGPEHPDVAHSLNNLGFLYWRQGKYVEAELLYQRALRIWEQQLGPEHPDAAHSLNNLATLYCDQGKYVEAEPLYHRALRIRERQLGPEHPQIAVLLNNLATLYYDQGKYVEAELLYQRTLRIREQQLGPQHPRVASPLNNLANLSSKQGKYVEAELLYQRALSIWEQQLGPEHPNVIYPLTGLANLSREQGKYAEAELPYQRALSICKQARGPQHPETAEIMHDLARLREAQGNREEARSWYARALAIREQELGTHHPKTTDTRQRYML